MNKDTFDKPLSLLELNSLVAAVVDISLPDEYWVEAELSEAREVRGHCYMELVEKDEFSNTPTARASAKCWASRWSLLRPKFERITGQRLHAGMKVLLRVRAQFHAAYGFSWIVSDINPEYTMGDLARRRQEIVRQLKAEGVFDLQKELRLPMFAQRIAVISSEGAAGYGDFCRQLHDNQAGYIYKVELFGAVMQGEAVEQSVIAALGRIYERVDDFDAVVIIRGGGATSEKSMGMRSAIDARRTRSTSMRRFTRSAMRSAAWSMSCAVRCRLSMRCWAAAVGVFMRANATMSSTHSSRS